MVLPFVNFPFPSFEPEVVVDAPLNLASFGVAGKVLPIAGHTAGSLVVLLESGEALVGEALVGEALVGNTLRGGALGGRLNSGTPKLNSFTDDLARAREGIAKVCELPAEVLYTRHGGPLRMKRVQEKFGTHG